MAGECVCLLARNGVGKTTTIRSVMGLVRPSSGRVLWKAQGLAVPLGGAGVDFSLALANRVHVLEKGSIRHSGPATELRNDTTLRERLLAL